MMFAVPYIVFGWSITIWEVHMGFQERNAWACASAILVVFIPYFWLVLNHPMAYVGLFALAVLGLIVLLTLFHVVNSIATTSIRRSGDVPRPDELDRGLELRAAKWAGLILSVVVVSWSIAVMFGVPVEGVATLSGAASDRPAAALGFAIPVTRAIWWVHVLFAGFVFSNVVYYGAIVVGYRRLAGG